MPLMVLYFDISSPPTPPQVPRHPFQQMARMMDSLVLDPFANAGNGGGLNNRIQRGPIGSANKPIGPVRPRPNMNYINNNHKRITNTEEFIPSNPNTAGLTHPTSNGNGDWNPPGGGNRNNVAQKTDDSWKASLRRKDPELQPSTLPSLTTRSRSVQYSSPKSMSNCAFR